MILDFIIVGFMVYYIISSRNTVNKSLSKKTNEIVHCALTLACGVYYPLFIIHFGGTHSGVLFPTAKQDFNFLGTLFIVGIALFLFLWALSAKFKTIRNPQLLETTNNYESFCKDFLDDYGQENKIRRKYIHTIPFGVVGLIVLLFYFLLGYLGPKWFDYARFAIAIIGISFAFTFLVGDIVRLLDFSYMPSIVADWFKKAMTEKEIDTFTSTSLMVFGFGPFLLFSFPIFLIVILVSAVADAFASISGLMAKNKHYFPKGAQSEKTIEGYIGGALSAFLCTLFAVAFAWIVDQANWPPLITLIVAGIIAIAFLGIDLLTSVINLQDNYLNPLITGGLLLLILPILNIPIF